MIAKTEIPNYIERLIRKIEKSPDFGYDDEEVELSEWCKRNNKYWCWNDSIYNAEILITNNKKDIEEMREIRGLKND